MRTSAITATRSLIQLRLFGGEETITQTTRLFVPRRVKPVALNVSYLDLPLFAIPGLDSATAIITDEEEGLHETLAVASSVEEDDGVQWNSDGIVHLHSVLLEESLRALAGRGNAKQKLEILEWIFNPDEREEIVNGAKQCVKDRDAPFSFTFCCRLEGMDDDVIRDFIRNQLPEGSAQMYQ